MGGLPTRKSGLGAVLAMLALVLQICVPGGFMVSRQDGAPTLVVCTGHGALVAVADDHGRPAKAPATHDNAVCAFAGHGVAMLDGAPPVLVAASFSFSPETVATPADRAPGRGLAAPPPPSQAPPLRTI